MMCLREWCFYRRGVFGGDLSTAEETMAALVFFFFFFLSENAIFLLLLFKVTCIGLDNPNPYYC